MGVGGERGVEAVGDAHGQSRIKCVEQQGENGVWVMGESGREGKQRKAVRDSEDGEEVGREVGSKEGGRQGDGSCE